MAMALQQLGTIQTPDGVLNSMICFDDDRPNEAMVHAWRGDGATPPTAALFAIEWDAPRRKAQMVPRVRYVPHKNNMEITPAQLNPEQATEFYGFQGSLFVQKNGSIRGTWAHVNGKKGTFRYRAPSADDERVKATLCPDWESFKQWATAARDTHGVGIFRGHGDRNFRLVTTLHRQGRTRLERYCGDTLHQFRAHAEAVLGMRINPGDGDDYSMLLGLAQHHGLPTPLLDWSDSPYIAAFFAFADALESASVRPKATHVRIYAISQEFIVAGTLASVVLPFMTPYVCPLAISGRNNPRLYAQQGKFLVTNVADLEHYLCLMQRARGRNDLIAADVPIACAGEALQDLKFMGLTASTMFPGLDGVCRMMRHEMSFRREMPTLPGKPAGEMREDEKVSGGDAQLG
jgi:hypothetical protein